MKSKELKSYNLPNETAPLSQINAKPTWMFVIIILIGLVLMIINVPIYYGLIAVLAGVICIIFMPRITVMEFYNDYFVMYNHADRNMCMLIYYDEVKSWRYSWSAAKDELIVELEDGRIEKIEAFSKTLFEATMNKYLKDKHKKK